MSFKVGDRVHPNTAVNWVNDTYMGREVLTVIEVKQMGSHGPVYYDVRDEDGEDTGLWIESELLPIRENKRLTISGASVRVVDTHPDEVVVEVEKFVRVDFEDFTPEAYVRVAIPGHGVHFTYIDPSKKLQVGDRVIVPFGYTDEPRFARVQECGRGGYFGPCKEVKSLLVEQELTPAV